MSDLEIPEAFSRLKTVRVGTENPPKLSAVRAALEAYVDTVDVQGVAVASGVPDQPVGFEEIVRGARTRARAALASGSCDLAAGIEDGLVSLPDLETLPLNIGCAWLTDGSRESFGLSSAFAYPDACAIGAFRDREPVGDLFDRLWQERSGLTTSIPSGRNVGNIGKLSLGVLPRAEYARHAVLCALIRFLHPDLYADEPAVLPKVAP
jgi:inosine/xanthosine triphosphatase